MKSLKEIFKDNPSLLETKEVKELIDRFNESYNMIKNKHTKYMNDITDIITKSEFFWNNGTPINETIKQIFEL